MGKVFTELNDQLIDWIGRQPMFFVATAPADGGHVNLSPKGYDTLRVLDPTTAAYLDLTGSGAETIAHTRQNGRITLMLCAFDGPARILRLFGTAAAHPAGSERFEELRPRFADLPGARSIVVVDLERVQTSCGYAVPKMELVEDRSMLADWATKRGPEGIEEYWGEKNAVSIDGLPALER